MPASRRSLAPRGTARRIALPPARLLAPVLLLALAGCSSSAREESLGATSEDASSVVAVPRAPESKAVQNAEAAADTATGGAAQPGSAGQAPTVVPSMIIRTGQATVQVDSLERAIRQVQALAQRLGGYVANTTIQRGSEQSRTASLEMKIPAARFDQAVSGLSPLGKVETVQVEAQDVGEEYVDVTARMANARRLEQRLLGLLETRTGKLEDVLAVERELARVREEIERYDGRLRYLRTRAAVSTLTVTVHEPYAMVGDYPGANPIANAFRQAWRNFVDAVAFIIAASGTLVPLGVVLLAVFLIVRRLVRRPGSPSRDSKKSDNEPPSPPTP